MGGNNVSVKRKIWEMINPFVFFMVCLEVSVLVEYLVAGMVYDYASPLGVTKEEFILSQSLWGYLLFYAATLVIKCRRRRVRSEFIKYGHFDSKWKMWKCIAAAFLAVVGALVASFIIAVSGLNDVFTTYSTSAEMVLSGKLPILLIAYSVIGAPLAEELIFRYMIFGRMRYYIGSKWAIILSAVLFGVYHMNMVQFIYCTIIGIIFAAIYDRSGNMWVVIGAHMGINLISITAYL